MGLIENLVSDLIRQSTGINARRAVRRIGGGKLLVAGGLAAAGALMAGRSGDGPGGAGSGEGYAHTKAPSPAGGSRSAVPPPPPPPGAVPPPPGSPREMTPPAPPPAPGAPSLAFAAARTAVAAALADDRLDSEERRAVERHLADSELTPEQVARVHGDLMEPAPPAELAALVRDPGEREALYELAALVLRADHRVSAAERSWLDTFATALGLGPERRAALEAEVFADGGDDA